MKHIFGFVAASILIVAYSATASLVDSSIGNHVFAENKHCECINMDCGCCEYLKMSTVGINGTVCVNFTYLPNDYGISITMTYNTNTVFNETVSARNPPPMCFGIPDLEKIQAHVCVRFYDLTFAHKRFHGCAKLSVSIFFIIHSSVNMGCFNIPEKALIDANAIESDNIIISLNKKREELEYLKEEIPVVNMI